MGKFKVQTQIKWNGNEVKLLGKKYVGNSIWEAGIIVQDLAVSLSPVDLGRLRGSIWLRLKDKDQMPPDVEKAKVEDIIEAPNEEDVAYVGSACFYGPYLEYGTSKQPAQPYLRPALDLVQGKVLTIIKQEGKYVFKDYLKT